MNDDSTMDDSLPKRGKRKDMDKPAERRFVVASTKPEDVVAWDEAGDQVFFTEESPELSEDVLKKLSKLTLIKYQQTLEIKKRLAEDDPEWSEINKTLQVSQSAYASPTDIAFGNVAKPGLQTRLVREDRVGYWERKGYVMATPKHMLDAKMRNVEGHFEHGTIGAPKEYLMVTTDENRKRLMAERDERRTRLDEQQRNSIRETAEAAGVRAFDA